MILAYSDESSHPDFAPGSPEFQEMMGEWMAFNASLIEAGNFVSGASLAPTQTATTLHKTSDGKSTTDGPYVETKEQLGGYYLVEAADLDEALEIAARIPIPVGSFEVRPVAFRPQV